MKYITILCFERGEIHSFPFQDYWDNVEFSEIANSIENEYDIKFSENNCQWIITKGLPLKIYN